MAARGERKLRATAYHEAGHAVAAFALRRPVRAVSIVPDEETLGRVSFAPPPERFRPDQNCDLRTRDRIERQVMCALAGPIAEGRIRRARSLPGSEGDFRAAVDMASHVAGSGEELQAYLWWLQARAESLVELWWPAIEALAGELLARRKLGGRKAREIIRQAMLQGGQR